MKFRIPACGIIDRRKAEAGRECKKWRAQCSAIGTGLVNDTPEKSSNNAEVGKSAAATQASVTFLGCIESVTQLSLRTFAFRT